MELKYESKYVHEALNTLIDALEDAEVAGYQISNYGLEDDSVVQLLDKLRKAELAADIFRAFLKASLNDDKETWTYTIPAK